MAFGFSAGQIRKYTYGARPPKDEEPVVRQLRLAHEFQNRLVEIERRRREQIRATAAATHPPLAAAVAEVDRLDALMEEAREALARAKCRQGTKSPVGPEAGAVRALRPLMNAAYEVERAARKDAYALPGVKELFAGIDRAATDTVKAARGTAVASGLYWATANIVMGRVKRTGMPPRFKRWTGEGIIAVQFQRKGDKTSEAVAVVDKVGNPRIHPRSGKPMMRREAGKPFGVTQAVAGNTLLKIEPVMTPEGVPHKKHVTVQLRIGTAADGSPEYAVIPTVMHRPIPADAEIKWAYLRRYRIATHTKYEVQFDLERVAWVTRPRGAGTVAVALGWRMIDGNLRVAHWVGDDGRSGEVVIGAENLRRWKICDELRSIRDANFNKAKAALGAWVDSHREILPQEFLDAVSHLDQWRSARRMARLVTHWRSNRLPGDEEIFRQLEGELLTDEETGRRFYSGGRKQDRHLYDWQEFSRTGAIRWRKAFYTETAIELSRVYGTVIVAEIDWQHLGRAAVPEEAEDDINRTNKGVAAVAMLRDCLTRYMTPLKISPVNIARTCYRCGTVTPKATAGRWVVCGTCGGERTDRAENAARNLLAQGLEAVGAARG